jgi:hypothetical protein
LYALHCIHRWWKAYPSNAITFDASVRFKQFRLRPFHLCFDSFSIAKGYNLSILSNSFFGHSQTGHSIVLHIVVGKRSWLQDGPSGPCVRTRHNGAVVVETSHCTYSKINSYLNAMPNSYMNGQYNSYVHSFMNAYIFTINWQDGNSSLDESRINVRYPLLFSLD